MIRPLFSICGSLLLAGPGLQKDTAVNFTQVKELPWLWIKFPGYQSGTIKGQDKGCNGTIWWDVQISFIQV